MLVLLCIPAVMADLQIDNIRAYVNEQRVTGLDRFGGNIEDVNPQDIVEIRIDITNNDVNNSLNNIKVYGEIVDILNGNDYKIDLNNFNLRSMESERKILTFTIPTYAEDDVYELNIKIRGIDYNNTELWFNMSYDLDIITLSTTNQAFDMRAMLANISIYCQQANNGSIYVKDKIDQSLTELSSCKANLAEANSKINNLNQEIHEKDGKINNLTSTVDTKTNELTVCNNNFNTQMQKCESDLKTSQDGAKNFQMMVLIVGLGILGAWAFYKNRNKINPFKGGPDYKPSGTTTLGNLGRGG